MNNNSLDTRIQHAVIGETNNAGKTTATDDVPLKGEIIFNSTLNNFRIGIGGNTPYSSLPDFLHVFTGANTSHAGTSGLVLAPSQKSSGDPDKFLCDDGSWKAVSSSGGTDTTYKFYLNGTLTYGSDSGGTNLSSPDGTINGIYAPTTSGTSGNMLKSNGNNNAPTWDSLENIIGKKTANYVLAGNGTASGNGVVSWQQLSLSSLSDAPNTGTLTLNGTGFSVYSPTASLSKTWYAPESAGTATNLFLKWDTTNSKPIWTTLSNILGSTSGNLLLGDGSTLTKAITTTKINGTSYTALSDTGSAQTQTDSIYAPTSGTTNTSGANAAGQLLLSVGSTSAPTWTDFTFPTLSTTQMLTYVGGTGWSLANITDTKNTVGAGPNTANHVLYLIGVAANGSNPSTDDNFYTKSYCPTQANYIGTDNYLYSRSGSSTSARVINSLGNGLVRDSVQTNHISLKTASDNEIGGIKVSSTSAGTISSVASSGNYYPVQINSNAQACVRVPGGSSYILPTAQENVLGGLIVSSDTGADTGYRNLDSAVAVPVFYGNVSFMYTKNKGKPDYDMDNPEQDVTTHYINVRDVVNGIIYDQEIAKILKPFLAWLLQHDPDQEWPWWDPKK